MIIHLTDKTSVVTLEFVTEFCTETKTFHGTLRTMKGVVLEVFSHDNAKDLKMLVANWTSAP